MHRFVEERFDGDRPSHHRLEFTGIQQIEENMRRLDESSNGSFPHSNMSSQEAGTIYLLHYDTLRMFRTALITMWELEFSTDGDFMSNLTDMMRCIHIPVKRLEILVERHPCNTESSFNNFRVQFETTSSGQECSETCLHRQSYHILEKFDYFLRRAENTFSSIIFT
ncbi:hypothetical protein HOLleu_15936 [Holothuria leucospilota]|uniref:Uncharacterized protein n=1 Tax=Holothuria leucospilota TaxID=206669 RepID=A0A9Q1C5E1_HOLLE|nr:hypothetical protein HOLleu_15936 [Holothuria leucospilota]